MNNEKITNSILKIKEIGDSNNVISSDIVLLSKLRNITSSLFLNSTIKAHEKNDTDFITITHSIKYIEDTMIQLVNNLNLECENSKEKIKELTILLEELNANINKSGEK